MPWEFNLASRSLFKTSDAAPNLRELVLLGFHPDALSPLSAASLTTLSLLSYSADWAAVSSFLAQCTSLRSLKLSVPFPELDEEGEGNNTTTTSPHYTPIMLPKLEFLALDRPEFGDILMAPNLNHLAFLKPPPAFVGVNWYPVRTFSNISLLTLEECPGADNALIVLISLGARNGDGDGVSPDVILPSLRKVILRNCTPYRVTSSVFCALAVILVNARPDLQLECDSSFFDPFKEMSRDDLVARYGNRISERA